MNDGGSEPVDASDGSLDGSADSDVAEVPYDVLDLGPCTELSAGIACGAGCATGTTCLDNLCGAMKCFRSGNPCEGDADCPSGSRCITGPAGSACTRSSGCGDSRDCPAGFACETGRCVDRRILCTDLSGCPMGFNCRWLDTSGARFCVRQYRRCATTTACRPLAAECVDVDGDGMTQCTVVAECRTNADCAALDRVCRIDDFKGSYCGFVGPCVSDGDCSTGYRCIDLWGDGLRECVALGGSCSTTASCPARAVCAISRESEPPECVQSP